jgi:hypothetical protein
MELTSKQTQLITRIGELLESLMRSEQDRIITIINSAADCDERGNVSLCEHLVGAIQERNEK